MLNQKECAMDVTSISVSRALPPQSYPTVSSVKATSQELPSPASDPLKSLGQAEKKPSPAALQQAVDASNKVLASKTSNELHFAIEKGTGLSVVKLISRQSGETILQFPSEAMLQIAKGIDQVTGAILKQKA
jgi:flagellar protein FlaG